MQSLPPALQPLARLAQFVPWFAVPDTSKPGKFKKFPCDWRTGAVINAHDPQYWVDATTAIAFAGQWDRGYGSGPGFVFTANDPFFFADADGCLQADGTWSPLAVELCQRLGGAAVEVSHSGRGLHIIGQSRPIEHGCKNIPLGLELYTSARFVALTGKGAVGSADCELSAPLAAVVAQYFPPGADQAGEAQGWTTEPVAEWAGPVDDDELIRRALASKPKPSAAAAFGGVPEPTFSDLWHAEAEPLGAKWPHDFKAFDASSADMALANHLAYWTGKDCERMERLMRASALVRDKWDHHRTYLVDTVLSACAWTRNVFTAKGEGAVVLEPAAPEAMAEAAATSGIKLRDAGAEMMGAYDQLAYFQGCIYVETGNRVYSLDRQMSYGKAEFDVRYGGHVFIIDPNGRKTSDSAWDAFTKNRVYAPEIVTRLCFRPNQPPGARVRDGSEVMLNTYAPYHALTIPGDAGKWTDFLARILPDALDRKILLHYLASMVQNPGVKFQWWPVLQGTKGNGKTLIIEVMTYLIGEKYTHLPNAQALARDGLKFNDWIDQKLFIGIEEINAPHGRRDFLDELKAIVTNIRIGMEGKHAKQVTGDNYANGICCTNHKDGVTVDEDERRYAILYTAQQEVGHLYRDHMHGSYFPDLYDWMRGRGRYASCGPMYGAAVIGHYLKTFPLEAEFDPAQLATRAPETSSTAEAISNSRGKAEQEILEAIAEERIGFRRGWVSAYYLEQLLMTMRIPVPRIKRRAMMQGLGYDWHPGLRDGRTNEVTHPDGRKVVLFVKRGHLRAQMDRAKDIALAYTKDQGDDASAVFGLTAPSR